MKHAELVHTIWERFHLKFCCEQIPDVAAAGSLKVSADGRGVGMLQVRLNWFTVLQ